MKVYVPATLPRLRTAVATGSVTVVSGVGFACTAALAEEYPGADVDDLDFLALHDAAMASLRLLAAGEDESVRVVLTIDAAVLEPESVRARSDMDRAVVSLPGSVAWRAVTAVRLDGGEVAEVIRAAAENVDAADLGDMDAAVVVGGAEDSDLAVYEPGEIGQLLELLGSS